VESALGWIGAIIEWIGQWIPRWIVLDTTQGAVKFVYGKRLIAQTGGIVCWWPAVTKLVTYPIARQANDLRAQTIVTKDGKPYIVGAMIVYEVEDLVKILGQTWDADDTIRDIALSVIHDVLVQYEAEPLMAAVRSGDLDKDLRHEARKGLAPYGIKVVKLTLTDLAPCAVYRLVGSMPSEGLK
jgi:regulator of protease activity HflC (stomatin/prohibitin superfamily)